MIILPHVGLNVGGDGAGTITITVVACVGEPTHQITLDDTLLPAAYVMTILSKFNTYM